MRLLSLSVVVACLSTGALAAAVPKCHNVDGGAGYLVVGDSAGNPAGVILNKAKYVYFNPVNKKPRMKVQFQACPVLGSSTDDHGLVYRGRMLVPGAGKEMCLTSVAKYNDQGYYELTVQKCKSTTKPSGGQRWKRFGADNGEPVYGWSGNTQSGDKVGYRSDTEIDGAIVPYFKNNYVLLDCRNACTPFKIKKTI